MVVLPTIPPDEIKEVFIWRDWFRLLQQYISNQQRTGFTGTITTAKLTGAGTNGSMTFTNGTITAQTPAT